MSPARRDHLRKVMQFAWKGWLNRGFNSSYRTFADALRYAHYWLKPRAPVAGPVPHLRTMVASPIRRSLTGQPYTFDRGYRAGRLTSRMGA